MPALAAYRAAFRTRPEDLLAQRLEGQRRLVADSERARGRREQTARQAAMTSALAGREAAHEHRMSELAGGADVSREAAETGREFRREEGETGFGRQKELLGLRSGIGEVAAESDFERSLKTLGERSRLGGEQAAIGREHDVGMHGLRSDLARDLQYAREGAADRAMTSELGESEKDREVRRELLGKQIGARAEESETDRAFKETLARRKAEGEAARTTQASGEADTWFKAYEAADETTRARAIQNVIREAKAGNPGARVVYETLRARQGAQESGLIPR